MKKNIFLIIIILLTFYLVSLYISKNNIKIPNESIRIRVLANSNSKEDQKTKKIISKYLMTYLNKELESVKSISEARNKINNSLLSIDHIISDTLTKNNLKENFKVEYGYNYFPTKVFKSNIYKEGYYESLLITLGSGIGDNFWCLLFPPLCLLDENEEVEYTSLINELFDI